jgi:hypothetical protein
MKLKDWIEDKLMIGLNVFVALFLIAIMIGVIILSFYIMEYIK